MKPASSHPDPGALSPSQPRPRCRFPRRLRITRKRDFERTMKQGVRLVDRYLMIWGRRNGLPDTRLGLAVGRRHGTAVRRNRLKRLVREAFRLSYAELPRGLDLVCVPQAGAEQTLAALRESLPRLAVRLEQRLATRDTEQNRRTSPFVVDDGPPSSGSCECGSNPEEDVDGAAQGRGG